MCQYCGTVTVRGSKDVIFLYDATALVTSSHFQCPSVTQFVKCHLFSPVPLCTVALSVAHSYCCRHVVMCVGCLLCIIYEQRRTRNVNGTSAHL
jgi:hypothetical protein